MSKKVEDLINRMLEKQYLISMGAGKLSKYFGVTRDEVRYARKKAQEILRNAKKPKIKLPNILILDIETAPIKAFVWKLWKENVSLDQISSDWFMLSWAAKWLYSAETMSDVLTPEEAVEEDDSRIAASLWMLLNKADVVIAHNGNAFDIPRVNARFIKWGLPPTKPYQQIDTLLIARKQFGFSSNKLEALSRMFGIESKHKTDFTLWVDCINGKAEALHYMSEYNKHDVVILEEVYLILRPWIKGHVNLGLYSDGGIKGCPNCGSDNVHEDGGYYYTPAGRYKTLRCECGAIARGRKSDLTSEERENIIISIAR